MFDTTQDNLAACASTKVNGSPSNNDGMIRQSIAEYHLFASSRAPNRTILSSRLYSLIFCSTCGLSSPSPTNTNFAVAFNLDISFMISTDISGFFFGSSLPIQPTK